MSTSRLMPHNNNNNNNNIIQSNKNIIQSPQMNNYNYNNINKI
jgi:hypothetical protein